MNSLVIYDSLYGNTEQIAKKIGEILASQGEVEVSRVGEVKPGRLKGVSLLIVGSPTQQFRPTAAIRDFLKNLPSNSLKDIKVAAFDTRLTMEEIEKSPPLPFFVKIYGYAAHRIAKQLRKKGGDLLFSPEGFYVEGMKGPLSNGELERAAEWAKKFLV